jgi:hypothetical protein
MKSPNTSPFAPSAILTIAEIKAAVESFDRGDVNVFDALDVIDVAVATYRVATVDVPRRTRSTRDAA